LSPLGYSMVPGGKGANQACTVGRLRGAVSMVGCVGKDFLGQLLKSALKKLPPLPIGSSSWGPALSLSLWEITVCVCEGDGSTHLLPAVSVPVVDTTAAGDIFNGALAVALCLNQQLPDAVAFANHAAALSATKRGAQTSIPSRAELERFILAQ
jgi:sugar/nucleoside kinase (ribokinase family)